MFFKLNQIKIFYFMKYFLIDADKRRVKGIREKLYLM
jgi:hypothetical protein